MQTNLDPIGTTPSAGGAAAESLFAAAVRLARKGSYADASKALEKALAAKECTQGDALDLQARIYAQQGLFLHAESCWHRAKDLDGGNPAYDLGLRRLRRGADELRWLKIALASLAVVAAVGVALLVISLKGDFASASRQNGEEWRDVRLAFADHIANAVQDERKERRVQESAVSEHIEQLEKQLRDLAAEEQKRSQERSTDFAKLEETQAALLKKLESIAAVLQTIEKTPGMLAAAATSAEKRQSELLDALAAKQKQGMDSLKGDITRVDDALTSLTQEISKLSTRVSAAASPTPPPASKTAPDAGEKPADPNASGEGK